jgi:AraC-like DNA-binding protein
MNRSGCASTAPVLGFTLPAERSFAIPLGCAVFVRCGTAAWQTHSSDVLMDVNHALLFPFDAQPAVITANESDAALTLFFGPNIDFGSAPSLRIVDSAWYLEHYRLALNANEADVPRRVSRMVNAIRGNAQTKPASRSAQSPTYGRSMQLYLNAALACPFSLRSIAQACGLSPFTASHVFHREAGIALRLYVRRLRLRTALGRIAADRDIAAVAQEFGFFDHAHFTKAFRAEFGIAPSEWRQFVLISNSQRSSAPGRHVSLCTSIGKFALFRHYSAS